MSAMPQVKITLTVDDMERLRLQAVANRQSPEELASVAVRTYLNRARADDAAWRAELAAAIAAIQRRLPPDISPEETEADITAAAAEVKEARRAARSR